jgi:hypothetical protein
MKNAVRNLLSSSLALALAGTAVCHFGVRYSISQIPAEQRARMADFDWVGTERIAVGSLALIDGILLALTAIFLIFMQRHRKQSH